jgi:hypothetical protein
MESKISKIGNVTFPEFTGERVYQIPFKKGQSLPSELARWQPTVDLMLVGINTDEEMYLMIDQAIVNKNQTQRRSGAHIDGNWDAVNQRHGGGGHRVMAWSTGGGWKTENLTKGGIILAADCDGAKVYKGNISGLVGEGGDCTHLDLSNMETEILQPNQAYIGNVTMIHEAVPSIKSCNRTLVRITLPSTYAA